MYINKDDRKSLTTVIITCHNYGRFLEECINSVVNQSIQIKEIIVVNDASSDDTSVVVKIFGEKIKYHEVNFRNAQKTRNFGLSKATGKYVIFLDADDYFENDIIEKMQKVLEKNNNVCLVYSDRYNFYDKKDLTSNHGAKQIIKSIDYDYSILKKYNYIALPSLIRKVKFNGFDESIKRFQDWDAWLTFLDNDCSAKRIAEPLFYVRFHGSNLTVQSNLLIELMRFFAKRHKYYKIPFLILQSKIIHEKYFKQ